MVYVLHEKNAEKVLVHFFFICIAENEGFSQGGFIALHLTFSCSCLVQACSCCDSASEAAAAVVAPAEEDQPDLDISDAETGVVGCQQRPREEPTNTVVISCHGPSPGPSSQTQ